MIKIFNVLFFAFLLTTVNSLNSQILDSMFTNENFYIRGNENEYISSLRITNKYDDSLWVKVSDKANESGYLIKMDDNLNELLVDTTMFNHNLLWKKNNKFYGTRLVYGQGKLDSIFISSYNRITKEYNESRIDDSIANKGSLASSFIITKEDEMVLTIAVPHSISYPNYASFNILVFDTMRVLKRSKHFTMLKSTEFGFIEHGDNLLLPSRHYEPGNMSDEYIYFINKFSLEIVDSIYADYCYLRSINDSLVFGSNMTNDYFSGAIINIKSKEIQKIEYKLIDESDNRAVIALIEPNGLSNNLDFRNTDSIYFCFRRVFTDPANRGEEIEVLNFDIKGNINFRSIFAYRTDCSHFIRGVKATKDGGLVICDSGSPFVNRIEHNERLWNIWIIKFMPNGFVGLTNIETNEKASLKVYPNPSKDIINVDIEADRFSSSEIELFDIQGRMVKRTKLNAQIGNRIDVSSLNPGAYTYRVVINGKGISGKVIIGE